MSWNIVEAKKHLDAWLKADLAVSTGKEYKLNGQSLTRADVPQIKERIQFWKREVELLEGGQRRGARAFSVIPRDL